MKSRLWLKTLMLCALLVSQNANAELLFVKQNSEPKYLPDNNGLCDQIYQAIIVELAKDGLEASVAPELYPVKRILTMLENGQADAFCGAGLTEERSQLFHYSKLPTYYTSNVLLAHSDETFWPESFEQIAEHNLVIGAFYGTSSSAWLSSHDGVVVDDKLHSLDEVVQRIGEKRGLRYFYYHDLGLKHYVSKSQQQVQVLPTKFRTIPQWLIYSKTTPPEFVEKMEQAMQRITDSGKLTAIQKQFLTE